MKLIEQLKQKVKRLKREITALYYAYQHPELRLLPKVAIALTLGYVLSPIDLIPDFIPVVGYVDDLLIVPLLITLALRLIPQDIMAECRLRAAEQPLFLKQNWLTGGIFIAIWVILLITIILVVKKSFE
jgi:uncharacterized membrane protein YkvA (DUF1232 family)